MTKSPPEPVDASLLAAAADRVHDLGHCLDGAGLPDVSRHLFAAASEIDRLIPAPPSAWWTGPFNGQEGRCALFLEILASLRPVALLETGTYRGTTTDYMAQHFAGPIFTCEADPRWYLTGRARLTGHANVHVRHQDSRPFLREELTEAPAGPVVVYLDAHLFDLHGLFVDLPLREEVEIVAASGRPAVIIVDDFAVPGDAGYEHVDGGTGRTLSVELLAGLDHRGAGLFFPTLPSGQETGARRGCAVIGTAGALDVLDGFTSLRRHEWPSGPAPSAPTPPTAAAPSPDLAALELLVRAPALERAATEVDHARASSALAEQRATEAEQRATEAEQRATEAEQRATEAEQRATEAEGRATEAERRAAAAEAEARGIAEQARREMQAFVTSTSWRISAPIRALSRLIRR